MKKLENNSAIYFKNSALHYPRKLKKGDFYYLFTKPFDGGENKSQSAHLFHSFANILKLLNLPIRSKILDIACGPGWLSEFLARSGFDVTGVDISYDLISIAKKRVVSIKYSTFEKQTLKANFIVADMEAQIIGNDIFHAAIFFDSLHHFSDPKTTLINVFESLRPGGKLFITEGIKPPKGSDEDKKLIEEMKEYGTLEKPFHHEELKNLIAEVGFVNIEAYEFINILIKRVGDNIYPPLKEIEIPQTNTIMCRKPGNFFYDSYSPNKLIAEIESLKPLPKKISSGRAVHIELRICNKGDTIWLNQPTNYGGFVCIGTKLLHKDKKIFTDSLNRTTFGKNIYPGEFVTIKHSFSIPELEGEYWIKIDLVDELIRWFEEKGSKPLEWPIIIVK